MRTCKRLLVATLVLTALPFLIVIGAPTAIAVPATPSGCTPTQVTLSATPNHLVYSSGTLVQVTISLHNRSAIACSFATGPLSPNFVLTNSAGTIVWGSCWFGGGPISCPDYLRHRTLAPGATYRERVTWDQRTGHPDLAVPAGRYTFKMHFLGLSLRATTSFVLTRSRNASVTLADSSRHHVLIVGDL